jgi:energy-coupling factor transporter ATP-binding protein EcfA2
MRIVGISLRNFRSIGEKPVELCPWRKCNILIGQNNSGKSNVIKAIQKIAIMSEPSHVRQQKLPIEISDLFNRDPENPFLFSLYLESETLVDDKVVSVTGMHTFRFDLRWGPGQKQPEVVDHSLTEVKEWRQADTILRELVGSHWGSPVSQDVIRKEFLEKGRAFLGRLFPGFPPVNRIPEFRQIQNRPESEYAIDGTNLIGYLANCQHPPEGQDNLREKFDKIERLVRSLLHLPNASLEVSFDNPTILLSNRGLRLPLGDYGTGVHELVILATAILSMENVICCIEEPEIHLHPTLQREFIEFITTQTSNQYLISTHSPTLINAHSTMSPEARASIQVFHLRLENGVTVGGPVLKNEHSLIALSDLGVKASDILQSNCVIWVEGPSDRIYLNRWLELLAPELTEGLHYSIMFYGGSVLSHLSLERDDVPEELVEVLRMNQYAIVLMDDDRSKVGQHLRPAKKRVKDECQRTGNHCWITDGREIENYLPSRVIAAACEKLIGQQVTVSVGKYDKFEEVLSKAICAAGVQPFDYARNKVKFAREFAGYFDEGDFDSVPKLRSQLAQVIDRIWDWNR